MLIGKVAELARGREKPIALRARRRRALRRLPRTTSSAALDELHRHGVHRRASSSSTRPTTCSCAATRRAAAGTRCRDTDRVSDGIARERALLEPLKGEADLVVDTSNAQRARAARPAARAVLAEHGADARCRSTSCRSATSTASRSTSTSCSTAASSRTRTGSRSCARSPALDAPVRDYVLDAARDAASSSTSSTGCFALLLPGYEQRGQGVPVDRRRLHRRPAPQRRDRRAARRAPRAGRATRAAVHHRDVGPRPERLADPSSALL